MATFVPKLFAFLIILLIGWLIAKAVAKGLTLVLNRLGFPKLIEKTGLSGMLNQSNFDATGIIVKLVYYFILLIALQLAFGTFGPTNPVSELLNDVIAFLPRIVIAIVLVIVAAAIANVVREMIAGALSGRAVGRTLSTVTYYLIVAFGVIAALNQIQIATTVTGPVLIAVLATAGGVIVVGFGGGLIKATSERWPGWLSNFEGQFKGGGSPRETAGATSGTLGGQYRQEPPTPPQGNPVS
ncbi:MAG: hypothetical protein GEU86_00100 [Actinophytocola sp.]|nr:hypothetical protein [Actinophytocola sp.]